MAQWDWDRWPLGSPGTGIDPRPGTEGKGSRTCALGRAWGLRSHLWPGSSLCFWVAKNEKKKKQLEMKVKSLR